MNAPFLPPQPERVLHTGDDFLILADAGVFDGWRKVELIEGELFRASRPLRLPIKGYEVLERAGRLSSWTKTELIDGVIYGMNAQRSRHAYAKTRFAHRIGTALAALPGGLEAVVEITIDMRPASLPEPDIVIAAPYEGDGYLQLPFVRVVIEVSDTTLSTDLVRKRALYADVGIPEYLVLDVNRAQIHQFWRPGRDGFAQEQVFALGDAWTSATIDGLTVATDGLL